ncbi:chain length-determining protein [Sulfuricaulis limicola]|uniref:Chain length-determining protein n=1 Tax=Sulfuricaulis limicola TaxID=1620215 RepID=A0A1B4XGT9_9GAMM|nr:XrtA system polysaccharide chain length determinant [Sulfuricaulis limicola]BAV34032.1 chain length-determining protein [Sulfuricaulis limicola]
MSLRPDQLIKLLIHESFHYRKAMVVSFLLINLFMLVLGLLWPKGYTSSSTILVDDKKIIQPLMQGAAVSTEVADRSRLAREVIFGRKIMSQLLEQGGWMKKNPTPTQQEDIIKGLTKRMAITNVGKDLIKIEYRDIEPERTFKVTQKAAELFISESLGVKSEESQDAFDFIDKQTKEYHEKLVKAEEQLKEFRSANLDARPGTDADISARLNLLQTRIEQASQDLKEAEVKKQSLEKQLSGEAEVATALSREGQFRSRIADLQSQLETLRLNYHDDYPDIVQLKHQIADLSQAIVDERKRREAAKASGKVVIDEGVINNPMYQQLKQELSQTRVNIEMLSARIGEAKRQLQQELERGRRVHGGEATLSELTRDYQVNRDIYQDLLRRRENARVSMSLDKEKQGLTIKIQEPATLPLTPSGLRFLHFVIGGLLLGVLMPVGLLYAKVQLDPRLRLGALISDKHKVPLLAAVPHLWVPAETQAVRRELAWLSLVVNGTLLVVVITGVLRLVQVI